MTSTTNRKPRPMAPADYADLNDRFMAAQAEYELPTGDNRTYYAKRDAVFAEFEAREAWRALLV